MKWLCTNEVALCMSVIAHLALGMQFLKKKASSLNIKDKKVSKRMWHRIISFNRNFPLELACQHVRTVISK